MHQQRYGVQPRTPRRGARLPVLLFRQGTAPGPVCIFMYIDRAGQPPPQPRLLQPVIGQDIVQCGLIQHFQKSIHGLRQQVA